MEKENITNKILSIKKVPAHKSETYHITVTNNATGKVVRDNDIDGAAIAMHRKGEDGINVLMVSDCSSTVLVNLTLAILNMAEQAYRITAQILCNEVSEDSEDDND